MKILMFAASLRQESLNKKLIRVTRKTVPQIHDVDLVELNQFPLPLYDGDIEDSKGVPTEAQALAKKVIWADAIIIATPEYNGGMPCTFKNVIDWVSGLRPNPWTGRQLLLIGASPGALGAFRGLLHAKVPFESIGTYVFPDVFALPQAHLAFNDNGGFHDQKSLERLIGLVQNFLSYAEKMK